MASIEDKLDQVDQLLAKGHGQEPETILLGLLSEMGRREVAEWRLDFQKLIDRFQPRRRRTLTAALAAALEKHPEEPSAPAVEAERSDDSLLQLEERFRADLLDLSQHHIFQWSTFYRECLSGQFGALLDALTKANGAAASALAQRCVAEHAHEIFQRGYAHARQQSGADHLEAVGKSLGGLGKFLDVVVELYSTRLSSATEERTVAAIRRVSSALLHGVLEGFAAAMFGTDRGSDILPRFPRTWAHYYAFLEPSDAREVTGLLEAGGLKDGVTGTVLPALEAIADIIGHSRGYVPVLGQLAIDQRRLDVVLRPRSESDGQGLLEIDCFLDEAFASPTALQGAEAKGAAVIVARLKPDVAEYVQRVPSLKRVVVRAVEGASADELRRRVYTRIDEEIYSRVSPRLAGLPLSYNVARDFPLRNPFTVRYYHVPRTSVRDLLRAFERKNGVRLWCSVRRSGKTTACFDLGTTTGASVIVSQTCDSTEQTANGHLFYDLVLQALAAREQLDARFVENAVLRCAPPHGESTARFVLVVDEYETLFGRLVAGVRQDQDLRYTVVQPLLNQLVAFTRDNLLVFMGQQPNAHFILMDQNQLSAYVEQDSFPLFQHHEGTTVGEFAEFLRKVLTDRIEFDFGFADAVHRETGGHPFLTVNLMVEFVEWLIDEKRPAKGLRIRQWDFRNFAAARLTPERLRMSTEYDFFRAAAADAISPDGAHGNRWLHAIYQVLRLMGIHAPDRMTVSRADFKVLCRDARVQELGLEPDELLRSGEQANFFGYDEKHVWPRVRLLGRLAALSRPTLVA